MDKKIIVGIFGFLFIWFSFLTQINVLNEFELFGVKPNIAIVVIVGIALLSGKIPGMMVGIAYGLIYDVAFGKALGVYTLIYALIGFSLGRYSNGFSKENRLSVIYMVGIVTALVEAVMYLIFVVLYGYTFEIFAPLLLIAKEAVYNMIIARLIYSLLASFSEIINKCKNSYYLL
ncbi:MAG: rod shape-determining protein MreD [Clostridia bacterium]|nr:rod shape-determining protein MreD [Clostridia bacterium]